MQLELWMPSGVLAHRRPDLRFRNARKIGDASTPFPFSVRASAQVEGEFLDVG